MKSITLSAAFVSLACLFVSCAGTSTRQSTMDDRPPRLQVKVNVPPTMSVLRDEEIEEAFAYRVSSMLKEQGIRGRIRYVDEWETPAPNVPVLAIDLMEWRVDRGGLVDCTFTATINTPNGSKRLGVFSGTSIMTWSRRDWFSRSEGFEDAARDAISTLGKRLLESGLFEQPARRTPAS
jgi:hypothetical protein